jgi:hypothetical protein
MTRTLVAAVMAASTIGAVVGALVAGNVFRPTHVANRSFEPAPVRSGVADRSVDSTPVRSGGDGKEDQAELSFDEILVRVSNEWNKSLPAMMDRDTRLDSIAAGPGSRLTYLYTIVNYSKRNLNASQLQHTMRPKLVANYKSSDEMKDLRNHNVELHYQYKGKSGEFLFELVIAPKDF